MHILASSAHAVKVYTGDVWKTATTTSRAFTSPPPCAGYIIGYNRAAGAFEMRIVIGDMQNFAADGGARWPVSSVVAESGCVAGVRV